MKKMIAITGADGTGKSTLIERLVSDNQGFVEVSIWDAMDRNLFHSKGDIDNYLCSLTSNARLLFLAHALIQGLEKARASSAKILILNAYYYKYFASELALGADPKLVQQLISFFPQPDLVLKLETSEEIAFGRKERLSQYECGVQAPTQENFVEFQKRALAKWSFYDQSNWAIISTNRPKEEVFAAASNLIEAQLV